MTILGQRFEQETPRKKAKVENVVKVENPDEMNIDTSDVEPTPPRKTPLPPTVLHDFVKQLMVSQGANMTEIVNQKKSRPTALEMWEEDDKRRQDELPSDSMDEKYQAGRLTPYEDSEMTPYEDVESPLTFGRMIPINLDSPSESDKS